MDFNNELFSLTLESNRNNFEMVMLVGFASAGQAVTHQKNLGLSNAYTPDEKYALAWNDIQHILGDYNPFDSLNERNVESAGKLSPPDGALLQPSNINNP